jgi:hypothetical protein
MSSRPRIWPYAIAFALAAIAWIVLVAWMHRTATKTAADPAVPVQAAAVPAVSGGSQAVLAHGFNGSPALLSLTGQQAVLEVRGLGLVTGYETNEEIWQKIRQKADNHATYLSRNPEDYPDSEDARLDDMRVSITTSFKFGARHAIEYWPVPVIVWGPAKDPHNAYRAAMNIADSRQKAGLGVTLFLWQEDANTADGAEMVEKLFHFFDTHPDVPAALVYSLDGSAQRSLLGASGGGSASVGHAIPAIPDSIVAMLVSRSDRVDRLVRPFAVEQTEDINRTHGEYDVVKLWNFYWDKTDDRGPAGFDAHYRKEAKAAGVDDPSSVGVMTSAWWQAQLPTFWKTIGNQGPGQFTPSPYLPVRWTTWQVGQFDGAPLLGYLHRPVNVKLTDEHGQPLKAAAQAIALKTAWAQAVAGLPQGREPKRVFYDTTGDRQWVVPLNQALAQSGAGTPSLDDVREGYDVGARIGNTGVSSPLVQIGLGLVASYDDGGASATVNRRPNGTASIVMVSPPDDDNKAAWLHKNGASPFK